MPAPSQPTAVIIERLENIQRDVTDTKCDVKAFSKDFNDFRVAYTGAHEQVVNRANDAHQRLDQHDTEIRDLKKQYTDLAKSLLELSNMIKPLVMINKILVWIAGIIGAGVIIFIGGLLTHTIEMVHP